MSEQTQSFTPEFTGSLAAQTVIDDPAYAGEVPPQPFAQPIVVPGIPQFVGRGRFLLVVVGMWLAGAAAGAGLYYWWFQSLDKAMPVFAVLVFVVACIVGSLLTAMVQERPNIAAMSLALMSAPLAAALGAGALYASLALGWIVV
ncbi:hypothetical protein [Mycolicibacterium iranicum]|uniref:Transmembrane protein n=1 Tax=Mycolicibacterium iranicum TaxID=912594 RepID=A0A178LPV3_MYCIR|nr:hypothetical protein [Mycolicibacterium iranicum]OAN32605.1 hypothetical protein A4X20_08820 [Mycolicibacterium iranicum]